MRYIQKAMRYIQRQWDIYKCNDIYTKAMRYIQMAMRYNTQANEIYNTQANEIYIQQANEIYTKAMRYIQSQWDIYKVKEI